MTTPIWIQTWKHWHCITTGAAVVADGSITTNLVKLVSDPGAGVQTRIQRITAISAPADDTTDAASGILRYYIKRSSVYYLLHEEAVVTINRTSTVKGVAVEWSRTDGDPVAVLENGDELWVGSEIADHYHWDALGGNAPVPA